MTALKEVAEKRADDEPDIITTERMRKNPRFDRHVGFAESCSKEMVIILITNQRKILLNMDRKDIIEQNTRPDDFDRLEEFEKHVLDLMYTRLSIHVL